MKKRGDQSHARGRGGAGPAWTAPQVLIALVLVVSPYRRECATLALEVHPSGAEAGNDLLPRPRLGRGTYRLRRWSRPHRADLLAAGQSRGGEW